MSNVLVASEDTRNEEWRKDNIGSKLLRKMGWKDGEGIGKRQNGNTMALRAVRKSTNETLGIGATAIEGDLTGNAGWSETTNNFSEVLENLNRSETATASSNDDNKKKKKKKKLAKKAKKGKLVLAQNLVTAGYSRRMREAKDLSTKSAHDLAAIFGRKPPPSSPSPSPSSSSFPPRIEPIQSVSFKESSSRSNHGTVEKEKRKKEKKNKKRSAGEEQSKKKEETKDKKKKKKKEFC